MRDAASSTTQRATAIATGSVPSLGVWKTQTSSVVLMGHRQSEMRLGASNAQPANYGFQLREISRRTIRPQTFCKSGAARASTLPATSRSTNSSQRTLPGLCKSSPISALYAQPTLAVAMSWIMTTHAAPELDRAESASAASCATGATSGLGRSRIRRTPCGEQSNISKPTNSPAKTEDRSSGPDESRGLTCAVWYIDREIQKRETAQKPDYREINKAAIRDEMNRAMFTHEAGQ